MLQNFCSIYQKHNLFNIDDNNKNIFFSFYSTTKWPVDASFFT